MKILVIISILFSLFFKVMKSLGQQFEMQLYRLTGQTVLLGHVVRNWVVMI
jgi:hypothetical protein